MNVRVSPRVIAAPIPSSKERTFPGVPLSPWKVIVSPIAIVKSAAAGVSIMAIVSLVKVIAAPDAIAGTVAAKLTWLVPTVWIEPSEPPGILTTSPANKLNLLPLVRGITVAPAETAPEVLATVSPAPAIVGCVVPKPTVVSPETKKSGKIALRTKSPGETVAVAKAVHRPTAMIARLSLLFTR